MCKLPFKIIFPSAKVDLKPASKFVRVSESYVAGTIPDSRAFLFNLFVPLGL